MKLLISLIFIVFLSLAVVIYSGKGDWLISGYNTASKEEREKYNIRRVRLVTSILVVACAFVSLLILFLPPVLVWVPASIVVFLGIVGAVLMNTWGKKK